MALEAALFVDGGGDTEAKRSLMLWFWEPERGCGAANWVFEVVVEVDVGGGNEKVVAPGAMNVFDTGAGAGAD
jgi:hypothetical protein